MDAVNFVFNSQEIHTRFGLEGEEVLKKHNLGVNYPFNSPHF